MSCTFCEEIKHDKKKSFYYSNILKLTKIPDRIVFRGKKWVVFPSVGPLLEGHLLITTIAHTKSLCYTTSEEYTEFQSIIKYFEYLFKKIYNKGLLAFEHGVGDNSLGGNSVNHTHVHILPYDNDIFPEFCQNNFKITLLKNFSNLAIFKYSKNGYIFYRAKNGKQYIINNGNIPSQFARKIIANDLNHQERWNWRKNYGIDLFVKTYKKIIENIKKENILGG